MLPLAFLALAGGAILLIAGVTGSSLASVVQGHPDHSKSAAPTFGGGGSPAGVTGAAEASPGGLPAGAKSKLTSIAKGKGWSVSDWLAVISRESGGNPAAVNKETGAYGIGQLNPENASDPTSPRPGSTASQYPKYKGNAVEQIEAMAEYIARTYGNPTNALHSEETRGWY